MGIELPLHFVFLGFERIALSRGRRRRNETRTDTIQKLLLAGEVWAIMELGCIWAGYILRVFSY